MPGILGVERAADRIAAGVAKDDRLAVGRERRLDVVPGCVTTSRPPEPSGRDHAHAAHLGVVPGGVDDPLAVAGERREEFVRVARRTAVSRAVSRLLASPAAAAASRGARAR